MNVKLYIRNALDMLKFKLSSGRVKSNDSYVNTEVIYNGEFNFIILVSFSEDYFPDAIELLVACNNNRFSNNKISILNTRYVHSSYDEKTDIIDKNKSITIIHPKNYILIGGNDKHYSALYNNINNISNNILSEISKEICANRCSTYYKKLIDDGVLPNRFKYNGIKPKYDEPVFTKRKYNRTSYDNVSLMLSKLPNCFTGSDLLKFINTYSYYCMDNGEETFRRVNLQTAYDYLYDVYINNFLSDKEKITDEYADMYKALIKNGSDEVYKNLVGPQYLVMDDEAMPGNVTDEHLDEIFRQQYERFTGIYENNIEYEDIDEQIAEDAEEENIRKTDKMVEIEGED